MRRRSLGCSERIGYLPIYRHIATQGSTKRRSFDLSSVGSLASRVGQDAGIKVTNGLSEILGTPEACRDAITTLERMYTLLAHLKNYHPDGSGPSVREALTALQRYEPPEYILRSDDQSTLGDPLAKELLSTRAMKRLSGIGFLGAIDYVTKGSGRAAYRRRHNRLEHSIGVALLAQRFCEVAEVTERERLTLVAAGLLHDVGHGPLSHTLEPVFSDYFGIDHDSVAQIA